MAKQYPSCRESLPKDSLGHDQPNDLDDDSDYGAVYRHALEMSFDAAVIIDPAGRIVFANDAFLKLFRCGRTELSTVSFQDLFIPPPLLHEHREFVSKISRGENIDCYRTVRRAGDGGTVPVEITMSPVVINGNLWGYSKIIRDIRGQLAMEDRLKQNVEKLILLEKDLVHALAALCEKRDRYTSGHQRNVSKLAAAISRECGWRKEDTEGIEIAALLHDIGKISVPAEILAKPDELNAHEFGLISLHPRTGWEILEGIDFDFPVQTAVLQHHEKMNGSGYPERLSGEDIFLGARILCVADVVEAMSSHRPYRPTLGIHAALEEISKNRTVLYDPEVVDICLGLFSENKFNFSERSGKLT